MIRFAERVVDSADRVLDEHGFAALCSGSGEAFVDPVGLHVLHDAARVPIERIGSKRLGDIFGFVAEPRA